jgi:hypothetical protein
VPNARRRGLCPAKQQAFKKAGIEYRPANRPQRGGRAETVLDRASARGGERTQLFQKLRWDKGSNPYLVPRKNRPRATPNGFPLRELIIARFLNSWNGSVIRKRRDEILLPQAALRPPEVQLAQSF